MLTIQKQMKENISMHIMKNIIAMLAMR